MVVVVDDNEDDRFLARRMLKRVDPGVEIIEYAAADLALSDFVDDDRFAARFVGARPLLLLDINMPRMTGFEFLDELGEQRCARIDVVILSASDSPFDRERAATYPAVVQCREKPLTRSLIGELLAL